MKLSFRPCLLLLSALSSAILAASPVWIATNDGIYRSTIDSDSGALARPKLMKSIANAGYLALHPSQPVLYSLHRDPEQPATLAASRILDDGSLEPLNTITTLPGVGTQLSVNPAGTLVAVSYYGSGHTGVYALTPDGALGDTILEQKHEGSSIDPGRQKAPHPHWAGFSPDGRFLLVPDLGTDQVHVYAVDPSGKKVTPSHLAKSKPGSGPRHLAFHPDGKHAYVTDELIAGVTAYDYDPEKGQLTPIQHLPSAPEAADTELWTNVSDLKVRPDGKFLYVINRGHDTVSVFAINSADGKLTPVEREPVRGSIARSIEFDPSGRVCLVAGTTSGTVAAFKVDQQTGTLTYDRQILNLPNPLCVLIQP